MDNLLLMLCKRLPLKEKNNSLLIIYYKGKALNKNIALVIYATKLSKLFYESGCRDGDVEDS